MGIVAGRTPEGEPVSCLVCGKDALVVPSLFPMIDVPCPHCGTLLACSGDPAEEVGGRVTMPDIIAAIQLSVFRGGERLRELQETAGPAEPAVSAEPTKTPLGLNEITDPMDIRLLEISRSAAGFPQG